jgi:predicted nucleic acid-binding protein
VSLVVDASVVAAALVDSGGNGAWAASLFTASLAAPALMPVEVANVLRRASHAGEITEDVASQAHADLLDLRVALFPYRPLGPRVWELRNNLTAYDAWYVALAEELGLPLATFDNRLRTAAGVRCEFMVPPSAT